MKAGFISLVLFFCAGLSLAVRAEAAAPFEPVSVLCEDMQEAREYLNRILETYPSAITIRMQREVHKTMAHQLCESIMSSGYANQYTFTLEDGAVTLIPEYSDWACMKGVFLEVLEKSALKGDMKQAYARALQIAAELKAAVEKKERPRGVSLEYMLALALHDYVCLHGTYKLTYSKKVDEAVTCMLLREQGVCEGYARMYSLLLTMCGVENLYISGKAKGQTHAWNMVKLDGEWVHVDVTWNDSRKQNSKPQYQYFGLSDELIARDHQWDRTRWPEATTNKLLYSRVMK